MYIEFVVIYIMLGVVIAALGAVIFLLIKLLKNRNGANSTPNNYYQPNQMYQQGYQQQYAQQSQAGNVVFCQRCATQFDASQSFCPSCGTRR